MMRVFPPLAFAAWGVLGATAAEVRVRTVAASGLPAPGTPAGVSFRNVGSLPLDRIAQNDSGTIVFAANLTGPAVIPANDVGVWVDRGGDLTLLLREGDAVPGFPPGVVFANGIRMLDFSNGEHVLFESFLAGPGVSTTNDNAIWLASGGAITLVLREGDPAPGLPAGQMFREFFDGFQAGSARVNSHGEVLIRAQTQAYTGVWLRADGGLTKIAATGDALPGLPDGVTLAVPEMAWNFTDGRRAAFGGTVAGAGVTPTNNRCVWLLANGGLALLARSADDAPELPDGVTFTIPSPIQPRPRIEGDGRTTLNLRLSGPGVDGTNDQSVYRGGGDGLALVLRESDAAPDAPPGAVFQNTSAYWTSFYGLMLNADVYLDGVRLFGGLWLDGPAGRSSLYRTGEPAPDLPDVLFAGFTNEDDNYPPAARITDTGHVAFVARVTGPGVDTTNDRGLWASDPQRRARLVLREGQVIEVAPGDARTIAYLTHPVLSASRQVTTVAVLTGALAPQAIVATTIGCRQPACDGLDLSGDDCLITIADLSELLAHFGEVGNLLAADVDGDGSVGLNDLTRLLAAFGSDCR